MLASTARSSCAIGITSFTAAIGLLRPYRCTKVCPRPALYTAHILKSSPGYNNRGFYVTGVLEGIAQACGAAPFLQAQAVGYPAFP